MVTVTYNVLLVNPSPIRIILFLDQGNEDIIWLAALLRGGRGSQYIKAGCC